jgi:hypothetical protein
MTQTRIPEYLYQYKTVSMVNQFFSGLFITGATSSYNGIEITLPPNFISFKNMWVHFVASFNASEPTGNRKFIGITFTGYQGGASTFTIQVPFTWTATGLVVDQKIDLTPYLNQIPTQTSGTSGVPAAFIIAFAYPRLSFSGTIDLCKVDFVYTTQATL